MIKVRQYRFDSKFAPYHILIVTIESKDYKVPHIFDDFEFERFLMDIDDILPLGIRVFHFNNIDELVTNPVIEKMPVTDLPIVELLMSEKPKHTRVKDRERNEIFSVIRRLGNLVVCECEPWITLMNVDGERLCFLVDMSVEPIHLKEARDYIEKHHRHCGAPSFHKFSVSICADGESEPIGVAVASTPKARHLMDGKTLEINRVCVDSRYGNVCSKLYAQVIRIGKEMGYTRFVTYTLPEESGASLKAVGFRFDGMTGDSAHGWNVPSRPRNTENYPSGPKKRWIIEI